MERKTVHKVLSSSRQPARDWAWQTATTMWKARFGKRLNQKIDHIYSSLASADSAMSIDRTCMKKHIEKWSKLQKKINPKWYMTYTITSGINCDNYIPEDVYYLIVEPSLNDYRMSPFFNDKCMYQMLFSANLFPEIVIRNVDGFYYDADFNFVKHHDVMKILMSCCKIMVKPSVISGGGKGAQIFSKEGNKQLNRYGDELTHEYLCNIYGKDFVIQKHIKQLDYFEYLNSTSVNTVRIFTYRSVRTDDVIVANIVLRMGSAGSEVDNQAAGGIACTVDMDGKLNTFAVDKTGRKHYHVPSGIAKLGELPPIPKIGTMCEIARKIAGKIYNQRVLGMDFCVDIHENVKLIEINSCRIEINFHQMVNEGLFHEYTDEVIDYCIKSPRSPSNFKGIGIFP